MLARGDDGGHFAYFGNGAIRRLSNVEVAFLRDECHVKEFNLGRVRQQARHRHLQNPVRKVTP